MADCIPSPRDSRERLLGVAMGQLPADLVVRGGPLANVYTGERLKGWGVAIAGSRVALTGPEADACIGPDTVVIEARGQVIAPGFVDSHTHRFSRSRPSRPCGSGSAGCGMSGRTGPFR